MNIDNLKKAREATGYTQMQVAEKLGISDGTYKNYEQGKREPNGDKIVALANLFEVTTDYLLGREPAPNPFADLNLDEDEEEEVISKYMSFPPEIRACLLDVLIKLGDAARKRRNVQNKNDSSKEEVPKTNDVQSSNEDDEYETIIIETTPEKLRADLERAEEEQRNSQKDVS